jgi:hypothetical protein
MLCIAHPSPQPRPGGRADQAPADTLRRWQVCDRPRRSRSAGTSRKWEAKRRACGFLLRLGWMCGRDVASLAWAALSFELFCDCRDACLQRREGSQKRGLQEKLQNTANPQPARSAAAALPQTSIHRHNVAGCRQRCDTLLPLMHRGP